MANGFELSIPKIKFVFPRNIMPSILIV